MREGVFPFFRATFYHWIQVWPEICSELVAAPKVLSIGDLHVENFGTWRDKEGRLVWGVNDFDEAYPLPYTNDLVRLAASAEIADFTHHLQVKPKEACDALLTGYTKAIKSAGKTLGVGREKKKFRAVGVRHFTEPARVLPKLGKAKQTNGRYSGL